MAKTNREALASLAMARDLLQARGGNVVRIDSPARLTITKSVRQHLHGLTIVRHTVVLRSLRKRRMA